MKQTITKLILITVFSISIISLSSCNNKEKSPMESKVAEFAPFELTSDLATSLNDNEKELVKIFFEVGKIADDLFWKQTFGDKSALDTITDKYAKEFAIINYGPWDRLNNNNPFIEGY